MALDTDQGTLEASRRTMVDCQVRPSDVTRLELIDAMLWAPREQFVPKARRAQAYLGEHLAIAPGRWELDPRVFAKMADAGAPEKSDLALVVGSGLGYAAAVLSRICGAVVALEQDEELAGAAAQSLSEAGVDNVISTGGALIGGCAAHAPYNLIFINGGISCPVPSALISQLATGGRLVAVHMDGPVGRCELMVRDGEAVGSRRVFDATAPLLPGFDRAARFEF